MGRLGPFPSSLPPTLGLAVELSWAPSIPLCRDAHSLLIEGLRNSPEMPVPALTWPEGGWKHLPTPRVLTKGCAWVAGSCHIELSWALQSAGCPAHSAPVGTVFFPSGSFTPPCLPAPQRVLTHKQHGGGGSPTYHQGQAHSLSSHMASTFSLLTRRGAHGRQPPRRERSSLPKTHNCPITKINKLKKKKDRPGTPPGISGGFLMQHAGRISVPGFALS